MKEERKSIPIWAVRVSMLLYVVACAIVILSLNSVRFKYMVWVGLAVFLVGFYIRVKLCSCPYCGSAMASKVAKINGKSFACPNCKKEIDQK
ncbi:MAG TPA: hypothetical protein GXX72_09160 [Clostridiaceae bacterium]|nr:hypothetical protein [Clostridiaceae bacterium]